MTPIEIPRMVATTISPRPAIGPPKYITPAQTGRLAGVSTANMRPRLIAALSGLVFCPGVFSAEGCVILGPFLCCLR